MQPITRAPFSSVPQAAEQTTLERLEMLEQQVLDSKETETVRECIDQLSEMTYLPIHQTRVDQVVMTMYKRLGELQKKREASVATVSPGLRSLQCSKKVVCFLWGVMASLCKGVAGLISKPTRSSLVPIQNQGNDCWGIATLHLLQRMPALRTRIKQVIKNRSITDPTVSDGLRNIVRLLDLYNRGKPIDSREIRAAFAQITDQIDGTRSTQEDPSTVLEAIIDHLSTHYQLSSTIVSHDGEYTATSVRPRHVIDFDLDKDRPMQDLIPRGLQTELVGENGFGFGVSGLRIPSTQTFRFQAPPDQLLLQANRFKQTVVQREERERMVLEPGAEPETIVVKEAIIQKEKIQVPIEVNQRITLPADLQSSPFATAVPYELTRCLLHLGDNLEHGHYTTLSKTADGWEYGNDELVLKWVESTHEWVDAQGRPYDGDAPHTLLNHFGYFFQYERVKTVTASPACGRLSSVCSKVAEMASRTLCPKKTKAE